MTNYQWINTHLNIYDWLERANRYIDNAQVDCIMELIQQKAHKSCTQWKEPGGCSECIQKWLISEHK